MGVFSLLLMGVGILFAIAFFSTDSDTEASSRDNNSNERISQIELMKERERRKEREERDKRIERITRDICNTANEIIRSGIIEEVIESGILEE